MAKKGKTAADKSFLEKLIGWYVILVFAALPLLYFSNRAASYVTSKQYFLIGTVDILAVLWTWLLLVDGRYRLTKKNLVILLAPFLFLLSLTISAILGVDPATSFFSIPESGTGLVLLYHVFIFACIVASYIRVQKERFLKYILQANLFASTILAGMTFFTGPNGGIFDIHSSMLNGSSGGATMGNSLLVGAYFVFSLFLTIYLIVHESVTWKKILYWVGVALMVFSPIYFNASIFKGTGISSNYLFFGEARIATVAVITGLFLSLFIWLLVRKGNEQSNNKKPWKVVGIIGIVVMVIGGGIVVGQIASPSSSLHAFFVKESGNRVTDWKTSIKGMQERPLLGWGLENSHVVYQKYLDPIVYSPGHGNEVWALHPHNYSIELLVDGGVIGFLFYLAVLVALFGGLFMLYRKGRIDGQTFALLVGMMVAYVIQEQMIFESIVSYTMFFSILAIIAGLQETTDEARPFHSAISPLSYTIGTVILVILFPAWLYLAYLPAQKMDEFQGVTTMTSDIRTKAYEHLFHSAGSYAIDTDPEFFTDPFFYSYDGQRELLKNNAQYQKLASTEITALLAAVDPLSKQKPYDYHLILSLLHLENLDYYLTGNPANLVQAEAYAKEAFALSPNDPQLYFAYAQTLTYEKNVPGAIDQLNKALMLNPTYQPAIDFKTRLQK